MIRIYFLNIRKDLHYVLLNLEFVEHCLLLPKSIPAPSVHPYSLGQLHRFTHPPHLHILLPYLGLCFTRPLCLSFAGTASNINSPPILTPSSIAPPSPPAPYSARKPHSLSPGTLSVPSPPQARDSCAAPPRHLDPPP